MLDVNGRSILDRLLDTLVDAGVDRIVLVIGHAAEDIRRMQGTEHGGRPMHYVLNQLYEQTNTIYSLYLAKDFLAADDTLLVEGDLLLGSDIVRLCIDHASPDVAVVARFEPRMNGTVTQLTEDRSVAAFVMEDEIVAGLPTPYFKTVNLYKLSAGFSKTLVPYLEAGMAVHGRGVFYERVFKSMTIDGAVRFGAADVTGRPWFEVDTREDLDNARSCIAPYAGVASRGQQ